MQSKIGRIILVLVLGAGLLSAKEAVLSPAEIEDGWILLFDGETTFGLIQDGSLFRVADGALTADGASPAYIRTSSPFSDFQLKLDFRCSNAGADAALFIRTAKDSMPTENGYQIRLGDSDASWPAGSIVQRGKAGGPRPAANQWHTLEITAQGEHISVAIDHQKVAEGRDASARSGFIGFKASKGGRFEFRDVKLKPTTNTALFNGSDLSGWKTGMDQAPPPKPGKIKKLLHMGGGSKQKESEWTVRDHAIHGEKGPGQLNSAAMYEDFVLQFETRSAAGKSHGAIYLRGDADKLSSGYLVKLDEDNPGAIGPGLASPRRKVRLTKTTVTTVAASGRHIAVWVNGFPVTEFTDTRPEGGPADKNAKIAAGIIALPVSSSSATADFTQVRLNLVAKALGGVIGKPAPAAPAAVAAATPVVPITPQQQAANQQKVGALMASAVMSKDPEEQRRLYSEVMKLDPGNIAAMQGLRDAQEKVDKKQQEEQQHNDEVARQQSEGASREATKHDELAKAQDAFYHRDLKSADTHLKIAETVAPNDPEVSALRQQIDALRTQAARVRYFWMGGSVLVLGAGGTLVFLKRRKKDGYLQIVSGLDNGRKYNLDREIVRIGAIAQDGGASNDIVVRDVEHMISRFHCEIHGRNGKFYLIDCNSANGTRVDKQRIPPGKPAQLKNGSRVDLGGTVSFRFGLERRAKSNK
jgi:3-keto-disaccharide hydrolase/FHA domain-containing protein